MAGCQDVSRLLTPYLDAEVGAADRQAVEGHLRTCELCARRAGAEDTARRVVMVRSAALSVKAPEALRQRCAALAPKRRERPSRGAVTWRVLGLSTASLVVVALATTIAYGVATHSETLLVAELALDHVKCFALFEPRVAQADAAAVASQLEAGYGWRLAVPASSPRDRLTLLGARRCFSTDGRVAHVLYRHDGRPVSLFMLPGTARPASVVAVAGHVARIWSRGDTTYVLVGSESEADLQSVAAYFQSSGF
jgi:anti-sigma factor (TIGR02949 family)